MATFMKKILMVSVLIVLFLGCDKKQEFSMDLNNFFNLDKNITYIYQMKDTHEVKGKRESFMKDRYMEKHLSSNGKNCIQITSYVLFDKDDIVKMDKRLRAEIVDNKLKTIDEEYCVKGDTIRMSGEVFVDLKGEWEMDSISTSSDGVEVEKIKIKCQIINISKVLILNKKRKVIHSQCNENTNTIDWYIAEKIGLYKYKFIVNFPEFNSQSINEVILIKEK